MLGSWPTARCVGLKDVEFAESGDKHPGVGAVNNTTFKRQKDFDMSIRKFSQSYGELYMYNGLSGQVHL